MLPSLNKVSIYLICDVCDTIVIDITHSVNQYDVSRTQVSLPGGFRGCIKIVIMAGDGHEKPYSRSATPLLRKNYLMI